MKISKYSARGFPLDSPDGILDENRSYSWLQSGKDASENCFHERIRCFRSTWWMTLPILEWLLTNQDHHDSSIPSSAKFKPGYFLFTVYSRPVSKSARNHQFVMTNIEQELTTLFIWKYLWTFDRSQCFSKLSPDEASQTLQSFITPEGLFSPTLVLLGTYDAVTCLQYAFALLFIWDLYISLLHCLDDGLAHNGTIEGLLHWVGIYLHLSLLGYPPAPRWINVFSQKEINLYKRFIMFEKIWYESQRFKR